ncbi:MAG: hypothetical protein IJC20_00100 [Clostridia bacterium]|nr:hypothetical protein [Clostridia bacterium]
MKKLICCILAMAIFTAIFPFGVLAENRKYSDLVVVSFGDSITAADKWQTHLEQYFGMTIINAGVSGDSTNSAMPRFESAVLNRNPDVVFISLGTNDSAIDMAKYVPIETYKANLTYFIDECEKIGAKVIVNIPPPVVDELYLTRHDAELFEPYGGPNGLVSLYAQAARDVATEQGVFYADLNAAFKATSDFTVYFPDGVHPSDTGYKLYADTVAPVFQKLWLGDVNLDSKVDQIDYLFVKRSCFKTVSLTNEEILRADINGDHTIDHIDYLLVKRICFGTYKVQ